jgi:acid stress chaperone HdeB
MRLHRRALFAAALVATGAPSAHSLDFSSVTCREFLASGPGNMAAIFMFLRGYHSGKHGVIAYDSHDRYAGRLGFYCKQHPNANLIEASEQILSELDRGL